MQSKREVGIVSVDTDDEIAEWVEQRAALAEGLSAGQPEPPDEDEEEPAEPKDDSDDDGEDEDED